jgi:WD40 repeat protein
MESLIAPSGVHHNPASVQWENIHIFISSTFNDMHAERDYLVKNVFPNLSEWCEKRKLRLIDIDLRWGVSEADATENKRVVQVCLDRIDECRPFFLCFLGQRRGWVPSSEDVNNETKKRFPKLIENKEQKNIYLGNNSVTEMEILHALIDPMHNGTFFDKKGKEMDGSSVEHAFFFLREPDYLKYLPHPDLEYIYTNKADTNTETADKALNIWRESIIPATRRPVIHYTAEWNENEDTHEIAIPLVLPTTATYNSNLWKKAFDNWKKRWAQAGITVSDNGEITDPDELEKAKKYNTKITKGRLNKFSYKKKGIDKIIIKQLQDAITERFGERVTEQLTPLQKELDQQEQFLQIASEGFIERGDDFDELNAYINDNSENRPFAVTACAGMGKTSFLAYWINTFKRQSGISLHYRFIGGSDDSMSIEHLLSSILHELKEAGKIKSDIPIDYTDMINAFPNLLAESGKNSRIILVIDALNQLESGVRNLDWIPAILPENTKLVISFKRGEEEFENYFQRQSEAKKLIFYEIKSFQSRDDRKKLVNAYLSQYFKELDNIQIEELIHSEGAENPLFLKVILSELRVFGMHNSLTEVIRNRFGKTPVTAFDAVLTRIENDPAYITLDPKIAVSHLFGWIAHSRYGLSVNELAELLVRERLCHSNSEVYEVIHFIIRQLRFFLAKRDGRIDFLYDSFKTAAINRYTGKYNYARPGKEWHLSLAAYFETLPFDNRHKLMEQSWQYKLAGMGVELTKLLWNYNYLKARIDAFDVKTLLEDFEHLYHPGLSLSSGVINPLILLRDCLRLSAHIIDKNKDQIPVQLWGRMADLPDKAVKHFLLHVKEQQKGYWLRPMSSYLSMPGGALNYVLEQTENDVERLFTCFDGRIVLACCGECGAIVYDTNLMKKNLIFKEPVISGCVSGNGRWVALALTDNSIYIWDTYYCKEKTWISLPETEFFSVDYPDYFRRLCFSWDGSILAVADTDGRLHVWKSIDGVCSTLDSPQRETNENLYIKHAVVVSKDGKYAITLEWISFNKSTLSLWDLDRLSVIRQEILNKAFRSLILNESEETVYVSLFFDTGLLSEWNYMTGGLIQKKNYRSNAVITNSITADVDSDDSICLSENGETVILYDYKCVAVLNESGDEVRVFESEIGNISSAALSGDGKKLFTYESYLRNYKSGGSIFCWNPHIDAEQGSVRGTYKLDRKITSWCFNRNWTACAFCNKEDTITIALLNGLVAIVYHIDFYDDVTCIAMNDHWLITGRTNGISLMQLYKKKNDPEKKHFTCKPHIGKITAIDVYFGMIAYASDNGYLGVIDISNFKKEDEIKQKCIKLYDSCINDVAITNYGSQIVCIGDNNCIKICDNDLVNLLYKQTLDEKYHYRIFQTSLDGRYVGICNAYTIYGGHSMILDTQRLVLHSNLGSYGDSSLEKSRPVGRTITENAKYISGLWRDEAGVWDTRTNERVWEFSDPEGGKITHCIISEDGEQIITVTGGSNTITLWERKTHHVISTLRWPGEIKIINFNMFTGLIAIGGTDGSLLFVKIEPPY